MELQVSQLCWAEAYLLPSLVPQRRACQSVCLATCTDPWPLSTWEERCAHAPNPTRKPKPGTNVVQTNSFFFFLRDKETTKDHQIFE